MILILNHINTDPHVTSVVESLRAKGEEVLEFSYKDFPEFADLNLEISNNELHQNLSFRSDTQNHNLENLKSVWVRRTGKPMYRKANSASVNAYINQEQEKVLETLSLVNPNAYFLNDPFLQKKFDNKFAQLFFAKQHGLLIPHTFLTKDLNYIDNHVEMQELIVKAHYRSKLPNDDIHSKDEFDEFVSNNNEEALWQTIAVHTNMFNKNRVLEGKNNICPILLQEPIKKEYEIRVTYVGGKIFVAGIDSQTGDIEEAKVDWRLAERNLKIFKVDIPDDLKIKITKMMKSMGLDFGCFDFILDKEGNYIFLEVNVSGNWYFKQVKLGYDISGEICNLLMRSTN